MKGVARVFLFEKERSKENDLVIKGIPSIKRQALARALDYRVPGVETRLEGSRKRQWFIVCDSTEERDETQQQLRGAVVEGYIIVTIPVSPKKGKQIPVREQAPVASVPKTPVSKATPPVPELAKEASAPFDVKIKEVQHSTMTVSSVVLTMETTITEAVTTNKRPSYALSLTESDCGTDEFGICAVHCNIQGYPCGEICSDDTANEAHGSDAETSDGEETDKTKHTRVRGSPEGSHRIDRAKFRNVTATLEIQE
jgi:hypothetical protein